MAWVYLLIAGFLEIAWAVGLKYSEGFTRLLPTVLTIVGMVASLYFLALAVKQIPLGTAYAIWTCIGTIGTSVFGILIFGDPCSTAKIICILLVVVGITGLKLS